MMAANVKHAGWLATGIILIAAVSDVAQVIPGGHATAFTTDTYYQPPHEQQVQTRFSGAEATPLPGGLLDVKGLKLEAFTTNGVLQLVARAPQCTYAMLDGRANSAGHLDLQSGDGKYRLEGEGFMLVLHQNATSLTLSNRVHTVMETGFLPP